MCHTKIQIIHFDGSLVVVLWSEDKVHYPWGEGAVFFVLLSQCIQR